jgi:pimeloyl-ACP methyl ester carboxylesterase
LSNQEQKDPASIGLKSFMVKTRFGRLHYVGPEVRSSDEVIIFVHGFGSNWSIWVPLLEAAHAKGLLGNQNSILVDLPSFGESENVLGHLRSHDIGQELLSLVATLGYKRVRIAGHSMGGFLALDLAATSKKILSVHIVAGSYLTLLRVANSPVKGLFSYPGITLFYLFQQLVSRSTLLTSTVNKVNSSRSVSQVRLYKFGGKSFLYASRNGIGYDPEKVWGSISLPAYAAFGELDKLVPKADMEYLKKILPSAHISYIAGAGHSMLVTHPEETVEALFGYI